MPDHARSTDPAVQEQLDRLSLLSPGADVLGLDRITTLLARLGDPHLGLPPVFHVAGTNGKGSTCAFLRAAIEAAGHSVHVYSSPHLVRFNERIRIAGTLIDDAALAPLLAEVLAVADGIAPSFFEVTTAAAFLAFARAPAAATIVEVGLGGRLDATNVVQPTVTGIAALGMDHEAFLGTTKVRIAGEKAGIAKRGVPLVTMDYAAPIRARIATVAAAAGAPVIARRRDWTSETARSTMRYAEASGFDLVLHRPRLVGAHQSRNLALAVAMLRHQGMVNVPEAALRAAADWATWPARMQRLDPGPLVDRLAEGSTVWLDGAHNPSAAAPVARAWRSVGRDRRVLVIGMLANKDAAGVLRLLVPGVDMVVAVPVEGHDHHAPGALAALATSLGATARTAPDLATALNQVATGGPADVLIAGSLYLAGTALAANGQPPI